jgi:RimJ/RimL family protein N-acetyltransferase
MVRPYGDSDAAPVHTAIHESIDHLKPWLPWYDQHATLDDTRAYIRRSQAQWLLRADFHLGIFRREGGDFLGGIGLHPQDWHVPAFEIGYWLRVGAEGRGYMGTAARVVGTFAFEELHAERLFIRCDARNVRSRRVAERLGCVLEGRMRHATRDTAGEIGDILLYAMIPSDYRAARVQ